jgi:hypothetical protein
VSRPGVIVLLLVTPLLLAAARDPRGDVTSCADGSAVTDPAADLVAVDAFADELGSAAVWRLTFAAPLPVPDRSGAPLRIDVLVRDPKLPTVTLGDERGLNRLVRWDDTGAEQPIDIVWLPRQGHTPFNPPVIDARTVELRVPGRILLGEAPDGTESVRRARWSVVVRDGEACDRLGDRPTLRLREPPSSTPSGESPLPSIHTASAGPGPIALGAVVAAAVLLVVLGISLIWRRASR